MYLSYNGIEFKLIRFTDFVRQSVWTENQTNYLYDSIHFRCECVLNPKATSYNSALNVIAPGVFSPVVTYQALAQGLRQPRQKLLLWMNDSVDGAGNPVGDREIVLESPVAGYTVDARVGPQCIVHRLDPSHGESSLWLDLEFVTDICFCTPIAGDGGIVNPMISNSWTQSIEHEPKTFAAIIHTSGSAVFRQDLLQAKKYTPDQFRTFFIHPIPLGYQREPPTVTLASDGCSVLYDFVDREQMMSFVGGQGYDATDIEVVETRTVLMPR